jgi:hypothetical protein
VWEIDAVAPANLFQQVRGATLRDKRLDKEHCSSGDAVASPSPAVTSSYCRELTNNPLLRAYAPYILSSDSKIFFLHRLIA